MYTININLRSSVYERMNTADLLRLLAFLDENGYNYKITENTNSIKKYME